ncbi:hypothetical protein LZ496_13805 [Sphingomonas sp. NSE70-1]|uniref:Dolichyl-phosphate-mannose-protein mannosyltransferase n=1 Tax=Sphingomonas caseinilyticus TaxID=2908205 RepID=A0ABT0RXW1_9SPHN|nr:hypothetical protein [Sphingomonas caseinilyticus]MCL6699850.1 hypothetical protein [Sphingomonas caseinilyticus]
MISVAARNTTYLWAIGALAATYLILLRFPIDLVWPVAVFLTLAGFVFLAPRSWRLPSAIVAGMVIRIAAFQSLNGQPLDDPGAYLTLAQNILSGRGMTIDNETYGTLKAAYPPAYPVLLAGAQLNWLALNCSLDLVATWAIFRLTNNPSAASLYFLFPGTIMTSIVPSKETLAVALVVLLPLCRNPYLSGTVAGFLILAQPAWAPLPILFFALTMRKGWWKALSSMLVVLSAWWIRNYLLFGQFLPLTSSAGLSIAVAVEGRHIPTLSLSGDEVARASVVASAAINQILADPLHYLGNVARMLVRSFLVDDDPAEYLDWAKVRWLGAAALVGQLAWTALIASTARTAERIPDWLLALIIAGVVTCLTGMWFEFSSRHRAFVVPLLILISMRRGSPSPSTFPETLRLRMPIQWARRQSADRI